MCNCEFCIKCDMCGHMADEHLAGEGPCFKCDCHGHESSVVNAWLALSLTEQACSSFREFADDFIASGRNVLSGL